MPGLAERAVQKGSHLAEDKVEKPSRRGSQTKVLPALVGIGYC